MSAVRRAEVGFRAVCHSPRHAAAVAPAAPVSRTPGVVIVGAGLAGRAAAAAIRALDAAIPITLVTACDGDVYNKPELSVALARGLSPEALCRETGSDMARRLQFRLLVPPLPLASRPHNTRCARRAARSATAILILAQGAKPALAAGATRRPDMADQRSAGLDRALPTPRRWRAACRDRRGRRWSAANWPRIWSGQAMRSRCSTA